jgi:hypothetical protein
MKEFHVTFFIWIGEIVIRSLEWHEEVTKIGAIKPCSQQCPTADDRKVGSIQALHDHSQRTQVEVMDKVSSMQSWMIKFDNNLLTITGLLSRLEPLLPGS